MIRLFTALCKVLLDKISEEQAFSESMEGLSPYGTACPHCGAIGKFTDCGDYGRWAVSYVNGKINNARVKPRRIECSFCNKTHALLPDTLTPYSPYTLRFKLSVLISYFERDATVVSICESYGIAVSTLYEWKKLVIAHKDFMLGVLISRKTSALSFLRGILDADSISETLHGFFSKYDFSFMQNASVSNPREGKATRSVPP